MIVLAQEVAVAGFMVKADGVVFTVITIALSLRQVPSLPVTVYVVVVVGDTV